MCFSLGFPHTAPISAALAGLAYQGLLVLTLASCHLSGLPEVWVLIQALAVRSPVYAVQAQPITASHAPKRLELCIDGRAIGRTSSRQEP